MIAVIFEVTPHPEHKSAYLDIAAQLKSELEQVDGFISVERFQSLTNENKVLSLSFFENEEAVKAWRNLPSHRAAQKAGRNKLFANYRLRIACVIRDYGKNVREEAPNDSREVLR
ncbi:antibiotic biosynthesis monooxygenase [Maritalea porphyrae]|jgi:heme-degrading monooxygenase HmoA|uniref:antibiotic biosynthesis monooxygenase family protein n=1 Tax=Maritalea porphyrae TaxID=880732 RepID=UPI0022AFECC5|nr:antibiotic biosynthesis monooxygenase [Maritalea porphyrae]MCZ4271582.1 antibiotic biosynthesis monooxygenase [Maritalea porphyrae]